ncbi:MAG: hypothetical protein PHF57_05795 [Methanoregula sp.]|nr:hypothetical protein [Methanoregula sp.]MDD5187701.1 hypothetical protein [Methanoregula sp.]
MASTTIVCFTGSGNSLKVAQDIADGVPDAEIIRISYKNLRRATVGYTGVVGIVFPVYYAGLPHMVRQFVELLNLDPQCYEFGIATYWGMPGIAFDQFCECHKKGLETVSVMGNCDARQLPGVVCSGI